MPAGHASTTWIKMHPPMRLRLHSFCACIASASELLLLSMESQILRLLVSAVSSNAAPTFAVNAFSRKILVADPSVERALAKHASDTSLANVMSLVGQRMFGLSDQTIRTVLEYDPRPIHAHKFATASNAAALVDTVSGLVHESLRRQPGVQDVDLGPWLFKLTGAALTGAIWGPDSPWSVDEEFADQFRSLSDSLHSLLRPFPSITARRAYEARRFVLARLRSFHLQNRASRVNRTAHQINVIAMSDPKWESNPDYFHIELLTSLGLAVTPSTMTVWLVRHLLASPSIREQVVAELRRPDLVNPADGMLDVSRIRAACPLFVASLYETLRLHMTAIPRLVRQGFDLPTPYSPSPVEMRTGDIVMLPMASFNKDPATWGPDVEAFSPRRFLASSGSVSATTVRRLRSFGVAGNVCPGKRLGFETILFVVASLLRGFEVEKDGVGGDAEFPDPTTDGGIGIGFERCSDDVRVTLRRAV